LRAARDKWGENIPRLLERMFGMEPHQRIAAHEGTTGKHLCGPISNPPFVVRQPVDQPWLILLRPDPA
jgi:hypothetical protein